MQSTMITSFTPKLVLPLRLLQRQTTGNATQRLSLERTQFDKQSGCISPQISTTSECLDSSLKNFFLQMKIKEDRRYLRFYYLRNSEHEDQGTG